MTEATLTANAAQEYMEDPQGRLVPLENIREIDKLRHALVMEKAAKIKALQKRMREFKAELFADIEAFMELSLERYDVRIGGKKGNVTLSSYDGKLELRRQISEHLTFDEGLQAAKALVDECLKEWSQGTSGNLRTVVNYAFQVDKEGRINAGRILGLRRHDIDDERWQRAMTAINESLQVRGSSRYVRLYEQDANGKMRAVTLDFAAI